MDYLSYRPSPININSVLANLEWHTSLLKQEEAVAIRALSHTCIVEESLSEKNSKPSTPSPPPLLESNFPEENDDRISIPIEDACIAKIDRRFERSGCIMEKTRIASLNFCEKDIELVQGQTGETRDKCIASLTKWEGDIIEAIIELLPKENHLR
jgi:hypothetical protein